MKVTGVAASSIKWSKILSFSARPHHLGWDDVLKRCEHSIYWLELVWCPHSQKGGITKNPNSDNTYLVIGHSNIHKHGTKFFDTSSRENEPKITSWLEIPAVSFILFELLTITIWIQFYDCILVKFLAKFTNEPHGLNLKIRMRIGLILSVITMVVSAIVETIRHDLANQNTLVDMSAMWLVPQYVLLGLSVAFSDTGQIEFYYSELPKSMASFSMAVLKVSVAGGSLVASLLTNILDSVTGQ
ncbi:putative proton-dependent oligopeptide transporter family [Helianthus annuus]|uniref:Proton-dependent oligopeptide transporter family n=1 Tax=Helianthus annuus TaxID=4232 RepID=A0A9K3JZN8_HELAN|nr:putative proton-dependent oligopeptide transporter family [Helianthus annuus]KAJ0624889.1 putative proton-dependent oligopeptide transporter family [Helianthus annuus]KAJ0949958.1 putative proton-dependent oligopeptide transporter family [Helianthus annuus]KAJ0958799.1 putative proton-dependent oligopeptide transporter family [Helianthus annuus]